jgi:type I restriction enzyme S subunit
MNEKEFKRSVQETPRKPLDSVILKPLNPSLEPLNPSTLQPLREGWRWVKLGEICELIMGQSPPGNTYIDKAEGLPFFQGKADFGEYFPTVRIWCNQPIKIAQEGDILISVRAPVGPVNMNNFRCCIGRGLTGIRCKDNIAINWFIFWYLRSIEKQIASLGSGSTFGAITRIDLINLQIPLPPLEEQKRISKKIQELMQEVERARTACEKQLEAAKTLPAAHLREVFESEEAKKWERKKVGEILKEPLKNGLNYRKEDFGTGIKFVNVSDVFCTESTDNEKLGRINVSLKDVKKYQLQTGDILIVRSSLKREGVAYPALFIEDEEPVVFCGFLIRIRPDKGKVAPFYLLNYLRSSIAREKLVGDSDTVTITNVDQGTLLSLDIPIPSLDEQQRITFELKEKMAQVENLQSAIQNQHSALSALPQSILRKAFSGEL